MSERNWAAATRPTPSGCSRPAPSWWSAACRASDNITLARAIQQYGVKIKQLWLNGYDQTLLNKNSSLMQGVYINNTGTLPFEAANTAKYGNTYSGMQAYIAAMKKYEPSGPTTAWPSKDGSRRR